MMVTYTQVPEPTLAELRDGIDEAALRGGDYRSNYCQLCDCQKCGDADYYNSRQEPCRDYECRCHIEGPCEHCGGVCTMAWREETRGGRNEVPDVPCTCCDFCWNDQAKKIREAGLLDAADQKLSDR